MYEISEELDQEPKPTQLNRNPMGGYPLQNVWNVCFRRGKLVDLKHVYVYICP